MNWTRAIALVGLLTSLLSSFRAYTHSRENQQIQDSARAVAAQLGDIDGNLGESFAVPAKELSVLVQAWRKSYGGLPAMRIEWLLFSNLGIVLFATLAFAGRKRTRKGTKQ